MIVFCKTFYLITYLDIFLYKGWLWLHFFKKVSSGIQGAVIIEKQYLIWIIRISHSQVLKNLLNGCKLYEIHLLGIWNKIFRTSIFLSTSEGLLLNYPETRSLLLWIIAFFPFLTSLVERQNVQKQPFAAGFQNRCS